MNNINQNLRKTSSRFKLFAFLGILFVTAGTYLLISKLLFNPLIPKLFILPSFLIALYFSGIFKNKNAIIRSYFHKKYPDLNYSLSLLDKKELNLAEQLQNELLSTVKTESHWIIPRFFWAGCAVLILGYLTSHLGFNFSENKEIAKGNFSNINNKEIEIQKPVFISATLIIQAPAYTGIKSKQSNELNAEAYIGSELTWKVKFNSTSNLKLFLVDAKQRTIPFKVINDVFVLKDVLTSTGFYYIKGLFENKEIYQSDYFKLQALADLAPKIEPFSKELYVFHTFKDPKNIELKAKISDDFKVAEAYIVATVARGTGENVKFREVRWPVGSKNFTSEIITKKIDLNALKFAPGDELYYYWAAVDNKKPEPNFAKSDTYFVVYKDTAAANESQLATMSMNILPEYFRSQRQIIIDTEKLIKARKKLAKNNFNAQSNEIGFDQKVLRLRYGQYLGEEFENSIGGDGATIEEDHEHEKPENIKDLLKSFTHAHDSEHHDHDHSHKEKDNRPFEEKNSVAAILEEYVHSHDDGELNTFYEQSTRSLLKMALEQMWQSELHLRLYEPEKALPFEQKALVFLKEAQQKARAYVMKTGFDPPPIKEKEKRLTGDLKKFNTNNYVAKSFLISETKIVLAETFAFLESDLHSQESKKNFWKLIQSISEWPQANKELVIDIQKIINNKQTNKEDLNILKSKILALLDFQKIPNQSEKKYKDNQLLEQTYRQKLLLLNK